MLVDCSLEVARGEVVTLLGPSGCGKTTLLRIIAGLEAADAGVVRLEGTVVDGDGSWTRPEDRNVGMVFQDWALFPHLNVRANVGYGLPRRQRKGPQVRSALEMVDLPGTDDRMPHTLSGGQQQRVALARAMAPRPSVLLLDEPFSNLDTSLRAEVRAELRSLLHEAGMTALFVTHNHTEALSLGDRVAVMGQGCVQQVDTPERIYREPASAWVAGQVGDVSMVRAAATGTTAEAGFGPIPLLSHHSGPVEVVVRPDAVDVQPGGVWQVEEYEFHGPYTALHLSGPDGTRLQAHVDVAKQFSPGMAVQPHYHGPPAAAFEPSREGLSPESEDGS